MKIIQYDKNYNCIAHKINDRNVENFQGLVIRRSVIIFLTLNI